MGFSQDAITAHQHVVAPALQDSDGNGGIAGNGLDLLLALFAALTGQTAQRGNGDGQQLNNNRAVDVGLYAQSKNRCFSKCTTGHDIVQAQNGSAHLIDIVFHQTGIHIGNGDGVADTENQQNKCGENNLFAKFGNTPGFADCLNHLTSPLPFHRLLRSLP